MFVKYIEKVPYVSIKRVKTVPKKRTYLKYNSKKFLATKRFISNYKKNVPFYEKHLKLMVKKPNAALYDDKSHRCKKRIL